VVVVNKINFEVNQLVAAECFLGYGKQIWNPRINFFLLGRRLHYDIFDLWQTRLILKQLFSVSLDLFVKSSHMWFIADKFEEFNQIYELSKLKVVLSKFVTFYTDSWPNGLLSNYKHSTLYKHSITFNNNKIFKFPHFVFVSNSIENFAAINEAFSIKVPSFSLVDSNSSPTYSFIGIPSNAKSLKSLFFFCILMAKIILYSNAVRASKFLFLSFKKSKKLSVTFNSNKSNFKLTNLNKRYYLIIAMFSQLLCNYNDYRNFNSLVKLLIESKSYLYDLFSINFKTYLIEFFFKIFFLLDYLKATLKVI